MQYDRSHVFFISLNTELGWFGEWPGFYNTNTQPGFYPQGGIPYGMPMPMQMGPGQPGQTVIIQPGVNGAPATVQQIPMSTI